MTWEPGMIAVCVKPDFRGRLKRDAKYPVAQVGGVDNMGLRFVSGPHTIKGEPCDSGLPSSGFWDQSRFRPLDDGDIQGLREKYGDPVGKKEGVK